MYHALQNILDDPGKLREMGKRSVEIIEKWGFDEDIKGLKKGLDSVASV